MDTTREEMKIRILLVDDHAGVRQGIRKALETETGLLVVAEAADGAEALRMADQLQPDIVLLDCKLPDISGTEVAQEIKNRDLSSRVLAMSAFKDEEYVWGMLSSGAKGYLLKEEALEKVVCAVNAVVSGQEWYSEGVMEKVVAFRKSCNNSGLADED
jgi:DNA-binding NarL/FixJ family response regulator